MPGMIKNNLESLLNSNTKEGFSIKDLNLTKLLKESIYKPGNKKSDDDFDEFDDEDISDTESDIAVAAAAVGVGDVGKRDKSNFEALRERIGKTTIIKTNIRKDNWAGFAFNSLCYTAFILTIGIVGANLEQLSELDGSSEYKNSEALRNKFEKMFKHSIFAQQSIKIDQSVNIDRLGDKVGDEWTETGKLRYWCAACDLQAQASLLIQEWPSKIVDFANSLMCNGFFMAFDSVFTKGKFFRAYFLPILLILLIYFQIPALMAVCAALLGSLKHPHFPVYWLGLILIWPNLKSFVSLFIQAITGKINPCGEYLADTSVYTKDLYDYYGLCAEKLESEYILMYNKDRKRKKNFKRRRDHRLGKIGKNRTGQKNEKGLYILDIDTWNEHSTLAGGKHRGAHTKRKRTVLMKFKDFANENVGPNKAEWNGMFEVLTNNDRQVVNNHDNVDLTTEQASAEVWGGALSGVLVGDRVAVGGEDGHTKDIIISIFSPIEFNVHNVMTPSSSPHKLSEGHTKFDADGDGVADSVAKMTPHFPYSPMSDEPQVVMAGGPGSWVKHYKKRLKKRGDVKPSLAALKMIYVLNLTPWWDNKNATNVLEEINAVRNYNREMRCLYNLESMVREEASFDYSIGGSEINERANTPDIPSAIGHNIHQEINNQLAEDNFLINNIIKQFIDALNAITCDITLINEKGIPYGTGVKGCIGIKYDEFNSIHEMNKFLRYLVPHINETPDAEESGPGFRAGNLAMTSFCDSPASTYTQSTVPTEYVPEAQVDSGVSIVTKVQQGAEYVNWHKTIIGGSVGSRATVATDASFNSDDYLMSEWCNLDHLADLSSVGIDRDTSTNMFVNVLATADPTTSTRDIRDEIITNHYMDVGRYDLKFEKTINAGYVYNVDVDDWDGYVRPPMPDPTHGDTLNLPRGSIPMDSTTATASGTVTSGVRMNGILRYTESVPKGEIFYTVSPFCHSPVKELIPDKFKDVRNHADEDVRSWFWSRTKYTDRVNFYEKMKSIINEDSTIKNAIVGKGGVEGGDVELWKTLINKNITAIMELDNQYTIKNSNEDGNIKKVKNTALKKINDLYNDKVFKQKRRFNRVMTLIHVIVIFHVVMYIWTLTEAADGRDPMAKKELVNAAARESSLRAAAEARAAAAAEGGGTRVQRGGGDPPRTTPKSAAAKPAAKPAAAKPAAKRGWEKPGPMERFASSMVPSKAGEKEKIDELAAASIGDNLGIPKARRRAGTALNSLRNSTTKNPVFHDAVTAANDLTVTILGSNSPPYLALFMKFVTQDLNVGGRAGPFLTGLNWALWALKSLIIGTLYLGIAAAYYSARIAIFSLLLFANLYDLIPWMYDKVKKTIESIGRLYAAKISAITMFIKLIPAIALFYAVGLWFAPTFGLGICIAYAIFVQLKMTAFILFGAKNANLTKAHLRKNRYGLTFMTLLMIAYTANQNLKFNTGIGVTVAITACMFIMLCT